MNRVKSQKENKNKKKAEKEWTKGEEKKETGTEVNK